MPALAETAKKGRRVGPRGQGGLLRETPTTQSPIAANYSTQAGRVTSYIKGPVWERMGTGELCRPAWGRGGSDEVGRSGWPVEREGCSGQFGREAH